MSGDTKSRISYKNKLAQAHTHKQWLREWQEGGKQQWDMKVRRSLSETLNRWSSVEVFHKTDYAVCMQQTSQTVQDFIIQGNLSKFLSQTPSWKRGLSISSWPAQNLQRDGVIILQNYNLLPHIWPESILHTTTPAYWRTITTHIPQTTNRQHKAIFQMRTTWCLLSLIDLPRFNGRYTGRPGVRVCSWKNEHAPRWQTRRIRSPTIRC